jgi:mycothiol synthase
LCSKYPCTLFWMLITDIIIVVIIRSAASADLARIQRICGDELDLEPDPGQLPLILARSAGRFGVVAEADGDIIGACYGSLGSGPAASPPSGCVDLLAVARSASGSGVGKAMLGHVEERLAQRGAVEVWLRGNPPVYLWPGVDARYTAMNCLAVRAGYERCGEAVDMAVRLDAVGLDCQSDEDRLAADGVTVRRAQPAEQERLIAWLRAGPWGRSTWPEEAAAALGREPAGCHVACRGDRYVGFACHGSVRSGWFGPMGTDEAERGRGIGQVLLRRCLADMRTAGQRIAMIGWVGPVGFYARAVDARVDPVYWLYRKTLERCA